MRKRKWFLRVGVMVLGLGLFCSLGQAGTISGVGAAGAPGVFSVDDNTPISAKADDAFTQIFYDYETGAESRLWGPRIDWNGQYYYLKKNTTASYIYQNYGPGNKTNPFITIYGNVQTFDVTSDASASYLYYKIEGEDAIYRLPLVRGASNPERRTFTFDGTGFAFESFTLAQDPGQFLLYSEIDANLRISIGLFSFDGSTEPIRTWTATLPYTGSYYMTFEASTGKIWLIEQRALQANDGNLYYAGWWFFSGSISSSGELVSYAPSSEIPGWNTGNLKLLQIGRYGRLVVEHNGSRPGTMLSLREFDPASGQLKAETLTTWKDGNGTERPLSDFYHGSESVGWFEYSYSIDGQGNLYLGFNHVFDSGLGDWGHIALFAPSQASQIGTPEPDPSADNGAAFPADNIVLRSTLPSMPSGTLVTGSRWEVYSLGGSTPVYTGNNTGSATTHKVQTTLSVGNYTWRVAYDWQRTGGETVYGSTKWSEDAAIEVINPSDPGEPSLGIPANPTVVSPADGVTIRVGESIDLVATAFDTSKGNVLTRSEWVTRNKATQEVSLEETQPGNTIKVRSSTPGTYEWRMRYIYDGTKQTAYTSWRTIVVTDYPSDNNTGGGSGGCDTGFGGAALLAAGLLTLKALGRRKQ